MTLGVGADVAFKLLECGKEKCPFFCERRPVRAVAIDEVKAESFLGLLHDSPGFAVGHAHVLGGFVERAIIAYATAKHGDASAENGIGFVVANAEFDVGRNIIERNHGGPFDGAVLLDRAVYRCEMRVCAYACFAILYAFAQARKRGRLFFG